MTRIKLDFKKQMYGMTVEDDIIKFDKITSINFKMRDGILTNYQTVTLCYINKGIEHRHKIIKSIANNEDELHCKGEYEFEDTYLGDILGLFIEYPNCDILLNDRRFLVSIMEKTGYRYSISKDDIKENKILEGFRYNNRGCLNKFYFDYNLLDLPIRVMNTKDEQFVSSKYTALLDITTERLFSRTSIWLDINNKQIVVQAKKPDTEDTWRLLRTDFTDKDVIDVIGDALESSDILNEYKYCLVNIMYTQRKKKTTLNFIKGVL